MKENDCAKKMRKGNERKQETKNWQGRKIKIEDIFFFMLSFFPSNGRRKSDSKQGKYMCQKMRLERRNEILKKNE